MHQKALSAMMALEGEIERLSQMRTHPQLGVRSRSHDCWRSKGEGQKKTRCQVRFADEPDPSQSANPDMLPGEEGSEGGDSDLEEPPELKPCIASFLWGSPGISDYEGEKTLPEPSFLNFTEWVQWKAEKCDTPSWWMELSTIPGEDNTRKLAGEVRASFMLPWQMHELASKEAPFQAPPVPHVFTGRDLCLQSSPFLPVGISERFPEKRQ